jgi:hypothetical protein
MSMSKLRRSAGLAFAIVIALGMAAGVARAEGEGNGDPFGLENSHLAVSALGAVTPVGGSQGEPDPLNSLPSAPENGGTWSAQQEQQLR